MEMLFPVSTIMQHGLPLIDPATTKPSSLLSDPVLKTSGALKLLAGLCPSRPVSSRFPGPGEW